MDRRLLVPLFLVLVAVAGCTSTSISRVETGMFGNDPERIFGAYELVESRTKNNQILNKSDFEQMGFNFKAPNVEDLPGATAIERVFGGLVFDSPGKPKRIGSKAKEFDEYRGFAIPYRNIKTVSDRVYFSEKETFRTGEYMQMIVIFHDDRLCYHQLEYLRIDTYRSRYAFAELLLKGLKAPGDAAVSALETIQEYRAPGLQRITPW